METCEDQMCKIAHLVILHALLRQLEVGGEFCHLLLVLWHLLNHLTQGTHVILVTAAILIRYQF